MMRRCEWVFLGQVCLIFTIAFVVIARGPHWFDLLLRALGR